MVARFNFEVEVLDHTNTLLAQMAELERKTQPAVEEVKTTVKYKKPQAEIPLSSDQVDSQL